MNVTEAPSRSAVSRPRLLVVDALTHFGGAHRVMVSVMPLLRADFDVWVLDVYGNEKYRYELQAYGIAVSDLGLKISRPYIGGKGTWKRPILVMAFLPRWLKVRHRLTKFIRTLDPAVIYTNQLPMVVLLATMPAVWRRCFVWHCHGIIHPRQISRCARALLFRRRAAAIAVSQATADQLKLAVPSDRVHVCYNGINIEEVQRMASTGPQAPLPDRRDGNVVFLLPATLQYTKGQQLAIKALAVICGYGIKASLWLAGDVGPGGDSDYVMELKATAERLGVDRNVHFLGWRTDIWAVMAKADVVMLGSLYLESFGLVLAEAMALGKACIGPRVGGVPEVIEDGVTGIIFEPDRVDLMARTMSQMAADAALRESCGRAGRARVMGLFNVSVQAEQISSVLKTLISAKNKSPKRVLDAVNEDK